MASDLQEGGKMEVVVVKRYLVLPINANVQMDRDEGKVQEIG